MSPRQVEREQNCTFSAGRRFQTKSSGRWLLSFLGVFWATASMLMAVGDTEVQNPASSGQPKSAESSQAKEEITKILRRAEANKRLSLKDLGNKLYSVAKREAPSLFLALRDGQWKFEASGEESLPLTSRQRDTLVWSFFFFGADELAECAQSQAFETSDRLTAMELMRHRCSVEDLPLLIMAATPLPEKDLDLRITFALRETAAEFSLKVPRKIAQFSAVLAAFQKNDELARSVLEGIIRHPSDSVAVFLTDAHKGKLISRSKALAHLGDLGKNLYVPVPEAVHSLARDSLEHPDYAVVREACSVIAIVGDFSSTPSLIRGLEHPDSKVQSSSLGALQSLSRLRLGNHVELWKIWAESEMKWFQTDAPLLFEALGDPDNDVVFNAVEKLSKHPLFVKVIGAELAELFDDDDPAVRARVCLAAGRLRARLCVKPMIALVDNDHSIVAKSAHYALKRITGKTGVLANADEWNKTCF